jgi:hypothetical protein
MIKTALISILFFTVVNASSDTSITAEEVKIALAKSIVKQQEMQLELIQLANSINFLKEEIKALRELPKTEQNKFVEYESNAHIISSIAAITKGSDVYVRESASSNSKALRTLPKNTRVGVKDCKFNEKKEEWCKLNIPKGYIRKYLLSFDKNTF